MCQNTRVYKCSGVPKVHDFDNTLRKMCQSQLSHNLTPQPHLLRNALERLSSYLLQQEYIISASTCFITQTKLSLSITWIWWWRWLPWPPGRPSPSSGTRCCFFVACPWLCQDTCMRVLEMSKYAPIPGKCQIIACSGEEDHLNNFNFGWGWYEMGWSGKLQFLMMT